MPTTTNFGWTTPADTDLVKDGAAAIRTLGSGIDTSFVDLKGGTTGQVLSKATNTDLDFTWTTAGSSFVGASVTDSSNQSVTQYVSTAVTWTSEDFDTNTFHSTSTNTSRMTIPSGKGGYYLVTGTLGFTSAGGGRVELYIRKNNSNFVAIRLANSEEPAINISEIMSLVATDYIELFAFSEASSPSLKKGVYGHFSIAYLGA
jgi:hypothetical protein